MPRVGLFGREDAEPFPAIRDGFQRLGWDVVWQRASVWTEAQAEHFDAVVVHGTHNLGRRGNGRVRDFYEARRTPVVVCDLPPLRVAGYWAFWPGAVNRVPEGLPENGRAVLEVSEGRKLGPRIMVCGQKDGDQAHQMDAAALKGYFTRTLHLLEAKLPGRPLTWRPHPYWPTRIDNYHLSDPEAVTFDEALADADLGAVVTYNSTCGLSALAAGVPVWCSEAAFYAEAAETGLPPRRDPPPAPNAEAVRSLIGRLSHLQWTPEEIATGEPLGRALGYTEAAWA